MKSWGQDKRRNYHLSKRVSIMCCSHNAKIWLAFVRSIDNMLSTFVIHCTWDVLLFENRKLWSRSKSRSWNHVGIASHRLWSFYKNLWINLSSVLFGEAFCSKPKWEHVSDFTAQHQVNRVKKQCYKYEFDAFHLKDWSRLSLETRHSLETLRCYWQTIVTTVRWSPTKKK